ncbi:MAG TPA: hypothetical protein PLB97_03125 [Accumulibacter sp.]|nr:hypothetical protein [Accumulibacter sp.]HPP46856.1 hypothetical protein [Accumulibacter sp.]
MGHLLENDAPIELYAFLREDELTSVEESLLGIPLVPAVLQNQSTAVRAYFAEYHLEYFRQRAFQQFPSRLHAVSLFATRSDAEAYARWHPERVAAKSLLQIRSQGSYCCSFHDASWLEYLRLPHSLSLEELDRIASYYWQGELAEAVELTYLEQRWHQPPVIEALFRGALIADSKRLPADR